MALTQDLSIHSELSAQDTQHFIAAAIGIEVDRHGRASGPGLTVYATASSALHQLLIEEAYGFRPTLSIGFQLESNVELPDVRRARRQVIRASLALLRNTDGVLLANGETTIMQRIAGTLTINSNWSEWQSYELFKELSEPYESRPLPSPLI